MSAIASDIHGGASAFARALRHEIGTVRIQHSDGFARRNVTIASEAEFGRIVVVLGVHEVALIYRRGERLPQWLAPVLRSLEERWGKEPGWDSYGAKPTDLKHAQRLLDCLLVVMEDASTPPTITPLSDSGLQAEWHKADGDLEIVVSADEPERYYYYDALTEKEEGGETKKQTLRLKDLIRRF